MGGLTIGAGGPLGPTLLLDQNQILEVDHALAIDGAATLFAASGLNAGSATIAAGGQVFVGGGAQQVGSGLTNNGHLVFTQPSTVEGPVTNAAGGAITALADVTFNDLVNGPGGYFGPGEVTFAGGFSPGASPAVVEFEGDLALGGANTLSIELGGTLDGQFDQLNILGDAHLGGALAVSLIDGFALGQDQQFLIADIAGTRSGQFAGLGEGGLVGEFSGTDLFITYAAGDGNDVALFTQVPEAAAVVMLATGAMALLAFRRPADRARAASFDS
jgi:hypothetical protein